MPADTTVSSGLYNKPPSVNSPFISYNRYRIRACHFFFLHIARLTLIQSPCESNPCASCAAGQGRHVVELSVAVAMSSLFGSTASLLPPSNCASFTYPPSSLLNKIAQFSIAKYIFNEATIALTLQTPRPFVI